ncbi:hypothetical protein SCYAM73S_01497 [Streptomyces cyaneofuscatus]
MVGAAANPSKDSMRWRRYADSTSACLSWASLTCDRLPKIASASSKSRMPLTSEASTKIRSRFFSVSPMYLSTTVERSTT